MEHGACQRSRWSASLPAAQQSVAQLRLTTALRKARKKLPAQEAPEITPATGPRRRKRRLFGVSPTSGKGCVTPGARRQGPLSP
jgi:hypothetical protein